MGIAAGASALSGVISVSHEARDADAGEGPAPDRETVERRRETILPATNYETEIHTIEAPNPSPTAFVIGGIHGNERGGVEAAHLLKEYAIDRGTLVVIPEANRIAVERGTNHGPRGDLNRQFPMGAEPTTPLARAIWNEIRRADPDYLLDMHTATGIYGRGGIAQAIFPTDGTIVQAANTVEYVNEEYLSRRPDLPDHEFQVGITIPEDRPVLTHKASADRDIEGWLVEVTRTGLDLREITFLHDVIARDLLDQVGIGITSEPALSNPF